MPKATGKEFEAIGFGEIMLRLSPEGKERLGQSDSFEKRAGGSELNVVSGISQLGLRTGMVSKLPSNPIGHFIQNRVRFCGVSDDYLIFDTAPDARLGIYYYESGVYPRKPSVVYDRNNTSVSTINTDEIPDRLYDSSRLFHTSGISLALGSGMREVATEMIKRFKAAGAMISFDVNYRATLWDEDTARKTIEGILPLVDILFVSEETSRRTFRKTGSLQDIMKSYTEEYSVSYVATTERKILSPSKHDFGSTIYSKKENMFFTEEPYEGIEVVDRIGSGDAYVSGVLFGLLKYGCTQKALELGNAMSAIKNTIPGDLNSSDLSEITKVMNDHKNKGMQSEMNR